MQSDGPRVPVGTGAIPPVVAPPVEPETGELHVHLPELSVWPITLAAAITISGAGLVTIWPVTLIGVIIAIWAIASWIQELRHERLQHPESH